MAADADMSREARLAELAEILVDVDERTTAARDDLGPNATDEQIREWKYPHLRE